MSITRKGGDLGFNFVNVTNITLKIIQLIWVTVGNFPPLWTVTLKIWHLIEKNCNFVVPRK